MNRAELIENMARAMYRRDYGNEFAFNKNGMNEIYLGYSETSLELAFAAMLYPTEAMKRAAWYDAKSYHNSDIWQAMLAASPLAPEGGRDAARE